MPRRHIQVGETTITVDHTVTDNDGNPVIFLMIEDEYGEVNLDLTRTDADLFIELLKEPTL